MKKILQFVLWCCLAMISITSSTVIASNQENKNRIFHSCKKKHHHKHHKEVNLNFSPVVFEGQQIGSPPFSEFDEPWLGWWIVDSNGLWTPAVDVVVKDGEKVAIHMGGTGGGLTRLGPFLQSLGKYDKVLGIRYDTTASIVNQSGPFVKKRLKEILKLSNVKIDLFPFSMGTIVFRRVLEVEELGKYCQIQHVVLIGDPAQGTIAGDIIADPEGKLAAQINNAIEASTDVDSLGIGTVSNPPTFRDAVLFLLDAQYDQFKGNAQLDSKLPGPPNGGEAIKLTNTHTVSPETFKNLQYYTINGFDFNLFPVSLLNQFYGLGPNGHPYEFIGQYIFGINDPATLALLVTWDTIYPNLGALSNFALSRMDAVPQPILYDATIPFRPEVLAEKSKFYRDNRNLAEYLVPENHLSLASSTGGAPIPIFMQELYKSLIESFKYRNSCDISNCHIKSN